MKHSIINPPHVDKQLSTFRANRELFKILNHEIDSQFREYSIVRIESETGNGSSHMLHGIANQLRNEGNSVAFFRFKTGDSFSDLTTYHLNNIHNIPFVFMDNIHHVWKSDEERNQLLEFLKLLEENKGVFFYSCQTDEEFVFPLMIQKVFSGKSLSFSLSALPEAEKIEWAQQLLNEMIVAELHDDLFDDSISNENFLKSLAPFIEQHSINQGTNYAKMKQQNEALCQLEVRMLRTQMAILDLEPLKRDNIHKENYEKSAGIRHEQIKLTEELENIEKDLKALSIQPRPSRMAMNLYIYSLKIEKCLNANKDAFLFAIKTIDDKLAELQARKKELTLESDKTIRLAVFKKIVDWSNVRESYTIDNRKSILDQGKSSI
jgi:hypothetical protein